MGGTFDPIHLAHLEMGREAKRQKELDEIWFMPSNIPPHKSGQRITDAMIRYHMSELAVAGMEGFLASDFELKHQNTTYTAETLERLSGEMPENDLFFILGGDSLFYLEHWYHPERILAQATVLAVSRDGATGREMRRQAELLMRDFGGRIEIIDMKRMDISSRMIREKIKNGENVKEYLPKTVYDYIMEHDLYH